MSFLIFHIFFIFTLSEKIFPSIKFTRGGIFGWFDALTLMKKPFHNKKLFGFLLNSTEPDLSMIIYDIVNNLNLYDANLSEKISKLFDNYDNNEKETKILLSSKEKCSNKTGNNYQLCKMFGLNLDLEMIGIQEEHFNILIGNLFGYLPTNLFFIIISIISIIYYIVQIILQYKFFKPSEYSEPSIISIIIFYIGDSLIFVSAILFLCSFYGVDNFITSIYSLDSVLPRITYSIASSFSQFIEDGLPNGLNPIFQAIDNVLNTTRFYINNTIDSFMSPTKLAIKKMVSNDENDPGVFNIYNNKIHTIANEFYEKVKKYPKLKKIKKFYMTQNFTSQQNELQNFYDNELDLSDKIKQLDSFSAYYYKVIESFENILQNLGNQTISNDDNTTLSESIDDLKNQSLLSFKFLTDLHQNTKNKTKLWIFLSLIFFTIGLFFIIFPIFLGLIFLMHNKVSRCVANTIAICPLISTILMFVLSFLLTGVGFALVVLSNQFELRIDDLINRIIDITIPTREIQFTTINVTKITDGNYGGTINLSSIIFPKPFNVFQTFVNQNEEEGLISALSINKIIKMDKYADEIGDFIINLSTNFNLPDNIMQSLNNVKNILHTLGIIFPKNIDGFFNWFIPITLTTKYLRNEIKSNDPNALTDLEPYLSQIDVYTNQMNSQFAIGIQQITENLPKAINNLNFIIQRLISSVLKDLSISSKDLIRNIYPILNTIQCGMIIGPYAFARNVIFYYIANTCAFISASGTLMIFGLVVIVTMIWIRRKGMMHANGGEIGFFEFICRCNNKKVSNDYISDSMETNDSNISYLNDSDFDISTSYCNNEFELDNKTLDNEYKDSSDDYHNWLIDDNENTSFSHIEIINNIWCIENDNIIINDYVMDPADDNDNFCIKEDSKGNYIQDDSYQCDPADDNDNFCIKLDSKGNYIQDDSYQCDPADDCSNWCINEEKNENCFVNNRKFYNSDDDCNNWCIKINS